MGGEFRHDREGNIFYFDLDQTDYEGFFLGFGFGAMAFTVEAEGLLYIPKQIIHKVGTMIFVSLTITD
jgi:hypothetical protein